MKKYTLTTLYQLLIVGICLVSTLGMQPAIDSAGSIPPDKVFWDTVNMTDFMLKNGLKIITNEEALIDIMGIPKETLFPGKYTLKEVRAYNPEGKLLAKDDKAFKFPSPLAGFRYDSLFFTIREGFAYLNGVQLKKHPEVKIYHPDITLSINTTLEEIKKRFPNAYASRNKGVSYCRANLSEDGPLSNYDFIRIGDYWGMDTVEPMWQMELGFIEKKLVCISLNKLTHRSVANK